MTTPTATAAVHAPETIEFVAGSADDIVIPLFDATGETIDIAGWTGRLEIRYAPGHPQLLAHWATDYEAALMRLESSAAVLVVDEGLAAVSLAWAWRLAQYDLALRAPNGRPARPHRGIARVIPGITETI